MFRVEEHSEENHCHCRTEDEPWVKPEKPVPMSEYGGFREMRVCCVCGHRTFTGKRWWPDPGGM